MKTTHVSMHESESIELVNLVSRSTLLDGGTMIPVSREQMREGVAVAATLRYETPQEELPTFS